MTTLTRSHAAAPRVTGEPDVRFGIATGLLVLALIGAWALGLGTAATVWLAAGVTGPLGVGLSRWRAGWLGPIAWACFTGFVQNRFGQLTFAADDVRRLALFTLAGLVLPGLLRRWLPSAPRQGPGHGR